MNKNERRICWYGSLLIALLINSPRFMALRQNGIVARYWHFNLAELLFQITFNLLFCVMLFYINLNQLSPVANFRNRKKHFNYISSNFILFLICVLIGASIQHHLFPIHQLPRIFWGGYFVRIALGAMLTGILIKIVLLLREGKKKELENERLKSAYMATELELLKEQLNPHFLFNSLSSLSGLIRENPVLAQKYVKELSNVFRYSLVAAKVNLVTLEEELRMLNSFSQLIHMRLENAFELNIQIDPSFFPGLLPHLSLQPLLENAVKHNAATILRPLKVQVYTEENYLVISNTIWEIPLPESSNGMGLVNLNERFRIMMNEEIQIIKNDQHFIVKLPLKP